MTDEIRHRVREITHEFPGLTLAELFERANEFATKDDIFTLVAEDAICANLHTALLIEPDSIRVFDDPTAAAEYERLETTAPNVSARIELRPGASFKWDSRAFLILNVGENNIGVKTENGEVIEIPISAYERLLIEGRVSSISDAGPQVRKEVMEILAHASPEARAVADHRMGEVRKYLDGRDDLTKLKRTVQHWAAKYKKALTAHGDGYLGLLPLTRRRGNRHPKLPEKTFDIVRKYLENYQDLRQPTIYKAWCAFRDECLKKETTPASYRTFCSYVRELPIYNKVRRRRGARAAYKFEPNIYYLEQDSPRHGDRPFECVHIDHTELDQELRESLGIRNMGRAWLTIMVDACTRRVLAFCITFDPPSYRACMLVLRECVRRHGRLPQTIIVDGGKEFQSIYFETLLARYEVTKKVRPPAKGRYGSVCERMFGRTNTEFLAGLAGYTHITKSVRLVTRANDPKRRAVWTLPAVTAALGEYFYEVYDTLVHPALGMSPRDAFNKLMSAHGERSHRYISYNEEFLVDTLPTTPKGTATLQPAGRGVKINYVYYTSPDVSPNLAGKEVPVRFDPLDCSHAYAFIGNKWVECFSEYLSILRGHSVKEVELIVAELKKQNTVNRRSYFTLNAEKIAAMIESHDVTEAILFQRQRDLEFQWARAGKIPELGIQAQPESPASTFSTSDAHSGFSFVDIVESMPDEEEDE